MASISAMASGVTRIASRMDPAAATRSSPIGAGNGGRIEAGRERVGAEVIPIIMADRDESLSTRRTGMCHVRGKASPVRGEEGAEVDGCRNRRCVKCPRFVQCTGSNEPVKQASAEELAGTNLVHDPFDVGPRHSGGCPSCKSPPRETK